MLEPLGENIALRLWHGIIGLPLFLVMMTVFSIRLAPADIALAVPALLLAGTVRFLFTYTLALSAFWTQRAGGAVGFGWTLIFLLGGAAAPPRLMPAPLSSVVMALPFRAMLSFPAEVGAGWLAPSGILLGYLLQAGWLVVFLVGARTVWRAGLRGYMAVGG